MSTNGKGATVLLAGTPRCGSTWLGNVLGRSAGARTVYEPDGPISDVLGAMVADRLGPYPVLTPDQDNRWYRLVWDLAFSGGWPWDRVEGARVAGRRLVKVPPAARDVMIAGLAAGTSRLRPRPDTVVVKSVNSAFTLEWIAKRYAPTMVVLRRNPMNVVSSWLVLDMANKWPVGRDPYIQSTYLDPLGLKPPGPGATPVADVAWNVGLLMLGLKSAVDRNPHWIEVSYDEMSADPVPACRELFQRSGLTWTAEVDDFLEKADDPSFVVHGGNPKAHPNAHTATDTTNRRTQQASQFRRRLDEDQITEAHAILERFQLGRWGPDPL